MGLVARRWGVLAAAIACCVLVGAPTRVAAAGVGERTLSFQSDAQVEPDGSLLVKETITYQFPEPRHGIVRSLVTRQRYDEGHERVYPLEVLDVSSPDGAPADYTVSQNGPIEDIRIGDPDVLIDGQHTYEITYRLRGLLNDLSDHVELYWNATGNLSDVPTDHVEIGLEGPAPITDTTCFQGPQGSTDGCDRNEVAGDQAQFEAGLLGPHEGVTVVAAFPPGAVTPPPTPILEESRTLAWGFRPTLARASGAGLALVVVASAVGTLAYRKGRDRQAVGSVIDVAFASNGADGVRRPLFERRVVPVQFEPPEGMPPGLFGTLVDERADVRDVSATIVDLAVRGYLRIEEIPGPSGKVRDYRLVSVRGADDELRSYEGLLLDRLVADGAEVELAGLKTNFHAEMTEVRDSMYREVAKQGWFNARPDRTRRAWMAIGVMVVIAAVGITALLAVTVGWGLLGLALVAGGLALVVGARWMPARTPKGSGLLVRALGFARFIRESEKDRARFAEKANLFTEYLPYAVALGSTQKWARAFQGLAIPPPNWYVGTRPFIDPLVFGTSVSQFSATAGSMLVATPGGSGVSGFSSAGGFSGGGGGGGGVGSW